MNFNETKKTSYSFPDKYFEPIQKNLGFRDEHELLWGTNQKIKEYSPKLFYVFYLDMLEDEKMKMICESLLGFTSKELAGETRKENRIKIFSKEQKISQIYSEIECVFLKEFF